MNTSAIGVLRRHPDIRLLRQSGDIQQTVALQQQILQQMWQQIQAYLQKRFSMEINPYF